MYLKKLKTQMSKVKTRLKLEDGPVPRDWRAALGVAFGAVALPILMLPFFAAAQDIDAGVQGIAPTGDLFELDIFGADEDEFGEDLYFNIYNRLKHESEEKALQQFQKTRQISAENLKALKEGTNIADILYEKTPGEPLNEAQVAARHKEILDELAEDKELADLEVAVALDVMPVEIFANGDESDSGFDLLVDLAHIEYVLFGTTEFSMGLGPGPGARPQANVINIGGIAKDAIEEALAEEETRARATPGAGTSFSEEGAPEDGAAVGAPATGPGADVLCPVNAPFHEAVLAAIKQERAAFESAAGRGDGAFGSGGPERIGSGGSGTGGAPDGGGEGGAPPQLVPAVPANWAKARACDRIFCFVPDPPPEYVIRKSSAYSNSSNCVACHFEKMNDTFKKLLSHNLAPSKVTGNLFESAKCKYGMDVTALKFNVVLLPQPAMTPPNDDLVTKGDFITNLIDAYEKYFDNPGRCDKLKEIVKTSGGEEEIIERIKTAGGACAPDRNKEAEAAQQLLDQSGGKTNPTQIMSSLREVTAKRKQKIAEKMEQLRLSSDAENQASALAPLMQEIDTMNAYFESFVVVFNNFFREDTPEGSSPCQILKDKELCS